jgi:hypothetical protein
MNRVKVEKDTMGEKKTLMTRRSEQNEFCLDLREG